MFDDLVTTRMPSALTHPTYKNPIYVGEGMIQKRLNNGMYQVGIHGGQTPACRPVSNIGENIFPPKISVFVIVNNGEGWILGRMRTPNDQGKDDGEPTMDKSSVVGNDSDAVLKAQNNVDTDNTAEVRVTGGNVVSIRSTGATNITLHPHGELIRIVCQQLLEFSDGFRIESGRLGGGKNSLVLDTLTSTDYKTRVGPSRTEVRVRNGKVSGDIVHQLSIDDLATGGGKTSGLSNFKWTMDKNGKWDIVNCKEINVGDNAKEPVVLGQQLVTLLTNAFNQIALPHNQGLSIICTVLAMITNMLQAMTAIPPLTPVSAMIAPINAQITQATSQVASATPQIPATVAQYLTPMGVSKAAILSDFFNTQKIAPTPGVVNE